MPKSKKKGRKSSGKTVFSPYATDTEVGERFVIPVMQTLEQKREYVRVLRKQEERQQMIDWFGFPKFNNSHNSYLMYVEGVDIHLQLVFKDGTSGESIVHLCRNDTEHPECLPFEGVMQRVNEFTGGKIRVDRMMVDELMQKFGERYATDRDFDWTDPFKQKPEGYSESLAAKDNQYAKLYQDEVLERVDYCNAMAYNVIVEYLLLEDMGWENDNRSNFHYYKWKYGEQNNETW